MYTNNIMNVLFSLPFLPNSVYKKNIVSFIAQTHTVGIYSDNPYFIHTQHYFSLIIRQTSNLLKANG